MKKKIITLLYLLILFFPNILFAIPEYGENTGFSCERCHIEPAGGKLTKIGEEYRNELKIKGSYRPLKPFQKAVRLIIGYIHLLTAIAWFGTILYVHILLKPAYAARGLPKGELTLGWVGIIILTITGILLTISRIPNWAAFYSTRFGILLSIKIILFAIMVASATIVTFLIGPRLKRQATLPKLPSDRKFTLSELANFDGKEGRPSYFSYKGKVYDVTSSKLWQDGCHLKKHFAGKDLTDMIKNAPHGEEKILQMPEVGELISINKDKEKSTYENIFYFMAYMNLIFVFLITFIIALWRW